MRKRISYDLSAADIILEDIDPKLIRSVAAIPMFIEGLDSLPVTVWAELGEK